MIDLLIAAASGVAAPAVSKPLEPLSFLVGHCWRGEFKTRKQVHTHCFEAVFDGKHIRDRHEVTGGASVYRGESIDSWDAAAKSVEYTYWNSLGGVSRGTMVRRADQLDLGDESYTGAERKQMVISTFWRQVGDTAYEAVSRTKGVTGDTVVRYQRVGAR